MIEMSLSFTKFLFKFIDKQKALMLSGDEVQIRESETFLKFTDELLKKISVPTVE